MQLIVKHFDVFPKHLRSNASNFFLAHQMSTCKMTVRLSSVPGSKVCSWVNHRVQPFSDALCLKIVSPRSFKSLDLDICEGHGFLGSNMTQIVYVPVTLHYNSVYSLHWMSTPTYTFTRLVNFFLPLVYQSLFNCLLKYS